MTEKLQTREQMLAGLTAPHDLAARIERADGPDRAQFCAAYQMVFPPPADPYGEYADKMDAFCTLFDAGGFIEAATQLVPEGWTWSLTNNAGEEGPFAQCWDRVAGTHRDSFAPTPAQALCAAALRAQVQP